MASMPEEVRRKIAIVQPVQKFWRADPHLYGSGRVHMLDDERDGLTYCGKRIDSFAGGPVPPTDKGLRCKSCTEGPARREEAKIREEQRQEQIRQINEQRELEQKQRSKEWWESYNAYLRSPKWQKKRLLVFKRANGICEGCGENRPTQVHHLTYKHAGHLFEGGEFLWELRAVCDSCHERVHP